MQTECAVTADRQYASSRHMERPHVTVFGIVQLPYMQDASKIECESCAATTRIYPNIDQPLTIQKSESLSYSAFRPRASNGRQPPDG